MKRRIELGDEGNGKSVEPTPAVYSYLLIHEGTLLPSTVSMIDIRLAPHAYHITGPQSKIVSLLGGAGFLSSFFRKLMYMLSTVEHILAE